MKCRHCSSPLSLPFLDLGSAPPSNAYLTPATYCAPETWFPLKLLVCEACWLVQTEDYAGREALFTDDYAYFSSFSSTWLNHAENYVKTMIQRFSLNEKSCVVEVAANDGYLLQYVKAAAIPCYGIEPTQSTAVAAKAKGVEILERFFGVELGVELGNAGRSADLMVANNVLAHVPDINDFLAGFSHVLKPQGVVTFEFPHLLNMVRYNQFDTAYHEHYSYLSLHTVQRICAVNGLQVFDVEEIPTHGGSLRVFAQRSDTGKHLVTAQLQTILQIESDAGVTSSQFYQCFQAKAESIKNELVSFLIHTQKSGLKVAAYGAAAKGNTLLNFAGIKSDLLPYVVDKNPAKQGKYLPGSRIPIVSEDHLAHEHPDYILILPWNLKTEVLAQLSYAGQWGARFVTAIPEFEIMTTNPQT